MTEELPDVSREADHRAAMTRLCAACGWRRGAELGLGGGHLSRMLLAHCPDLHLTGVDTMKRSERAERVRRLEREFDGRFCVFPTSTTRAARHVRDATLDFIFIDAGHSESAVHEDIRRWHAKVKPGGWILGHDYGHPKYPGVARAVDRWFGERVQLLCHTIWAAPGGVVHSRPSV
jgi:SAM-dependent methyltransferase